MDTDKTKVIFRKWDDGQVIALFPEHAGDMNPSTCMSYMHVGQHGAANVSIVSSTKPATSEDYAELKKELEQIGYNLEIIKRFRYEHQQMRQKEIFGK